MDVNRFSGAVPTSLPDGLEEFAVDDNPDIIGDPSTILCGYNKM
jgi:hypothetical protein